MHAITSLVDGQPFDVVVVATRANVFQLGLYFGEKAIGPDTVILPAFEGAHHLKFWAKDFPENPIALSVFNIRATKDADGCIHQSHPCGDLGLSWGSNEIDDRLRQLVVALNGRRFKARPAPSTIVAEIWAKHVFAAAAIAAAHLDKMTLRDSLRFGRRDMYWQILKEGLAVGETYDVKGLRTYVDRYRTGFQRESVPIQIPTPIAVGGQAGAEAFCLLGTMVALAQLAKVRVAWLQHAAAAKPTALPILSPGSLARRLPPTA